MSKLDQLEQANHAHRQVRGTQDSQVQDPGPTGEANGHSGPEEAGHTGPAAEPQIAQEEGNIQVAQEEGNNQVVHRVPGPMNTITMHGTEQVTISFPGGVRVHLSALLGGTAARYHSLSLLSQV